MTDREAIEYAYHHMDECIYKIKSVNDYASKNRQRDLSDHQKKLIVLKTENLRH